jgi:hypothetical protein
MHVTARTALLAVSATIMAWLGGATPASATTCSQDGVALLCVNATPVQDVLALQYQITQVDGPGSYSIHYVETVSGTQSNPQSAGPIGYQQTVTGTLYAGLGKCYNLFLTSTAGTSNVAGPVCG